MPVLNSVAAIHDEMIEWRRDFHAHPELDYNVHRTASVVADKLRDFGCDEVVTGIGQTGVVGLIRGAAPGGVVGLRSDMDALPIEEATGLPHASTDPGKMHACGHDGHMTMLLGAAKHLAETRNFAGTVAVIFQPAEEMGAGGRAMVEDGLMERFGIERVYGMHNTPGLPTGTFITAPGPVMASSDEYCVTIRGYGGHAARPQRAVDPTLIAAQIITAIQTIASRNLDPLDQIALSNTTFKTSGDAINVIPETVELKGTYRCFTEEARALARKRLGEIFESTAAAFGAAAEIEWVEGYPATYNDPEAASFICDVAEEISDQVWRAGTPVMGSEDFSYMLQARPGAMIFIGNGDSASLHHPAYDFDDDALPAGASWWIRLAERALPLKG